MNSYLILAAVVAFVLNGFYWNAHGSNVADARWTAKITAERLAATEAARSKEQRWQGVVNETVKTMAAQRASVQRNLDVALNGLRDRPSRLDVPGSTGTCPASRTGAELSREDAEFLSREAARADGLRAGLEACYKYADTVK